MNMHLMFRYIKQDLLIDAESLRKRKEEIEYEKEKEMKKRNGRYNCPCINITPTFQSL